MLGIQGVRPEGERLKWLEGDRAVQKIATADLFSDFHTIEALALQEVKRPNELATNLTRIYQAVFNADLGRYDPGSVREAAPQMISAIFDLRMSLRDRIPDWHARNLMTHETQRALRDCFRVARYASDMLGEMLIGFDQLGEGGKPYRAFTGPHMNTLANAAFYTGQPLPFRSGDVMLVRGMLHNSAAIARIGDVDSQFSHACIIYVDPQGEHWVIEALIEDGAVITRLEDALSHQIGRAVLFRPRDPVLGHRAAELIHAHVGDSLRSGRRIAYDFSMLMSNYRRLFCSKLVRQAFDRASLGQFMLPTFHTRFVQNRDFYKRLGVKARETFAPGDMDIEPHFDLVAEWQDYRVTSRLRMQDMLMTKLFEWMEHRDWRFKEDWTIRTISLLGRFSTHLSEDARALVGSVVPKIPPYMRRRTIATIAMLHKTAEPLLASLEELERASIRDSGRPLHPRQILNSSREVASDLGRTDRLSGWADG